MAFTVLLLWGSNSAEAKVLLLTSLDAELNRPPLRFKSWDINKKLEKIARKRLKEFDLEVHHHVDQYKLYEMLQRKEIEAIFWVSHSAGTVRGISDAFSAVQILDYQNRNLAPLFYQLPRDLNYLALVGCQSQIILNAWKTNPRIDLDHPVSLAYFLEDKKVDARRSLKRAIKNYRSLQGMRSDFSDDEDERDDLEDLDMKELNLSVTRSASHSPAISARLMLNNQVIALFEALPAGHIQQMNLQLKLSEAELKNLKLILESGGGAREEESLGTLSITDETGGEWKLFSKPDGTPIGHGTHIYRYSKNQAAI